MMILNYAMISAAIPAILLVIIGQRMLASAPQEQQRGVWIRIWLVTAVLVTLPFTLTAKDISTRRTTLFLLLLLPLLEGILALLIIRWREVYALCKERRRWWVVIGILVTLIAASALGELSLPLLLAAPALVFAGAWTLVGRIRPGWLIGAGWLLAILQFLDAAGITAPHWVYANGGWRGAYKLLSAAASALAPLVAAGLLWRGLGARERGETSRGWKYTSLALLMALAVSAVTLRHGILVKATSRAAEDHLPFGTLAAAVIAGLVLIFALANHEKGLLQKTHRWVGITFTVLFPAAIIVTYSLAWGVDPQAITAARAERIGQAIEKYHQDEYQYPPILEQLFPHYTGWNWISGPLTGRGQTWCYEKGVLQNGEDYYRLGYVIF